MFGAPYEQHETICKGRNQVLNIKELINGKYTALNSAIKIECLRDNIFISQIPFVENIKTDGLSSIITVL